MRWILLLAAIAAATPTDAIADETRILVRALAHDAKLIGDIVGGVRITVTNTHDGRVLAQGVTAGATGDTDLIMREPRSRGGTVFDTEGAAGFTATMDLDEPTWVEIAAEGPLDFPQAITRASTRLLIVPGVDLLGEGIVLDLHGYIVEVVEMRREDQEISVQARVRMLCSCPTAPDGLWQVDTVQARLKADGSVVASTPLEYTGADSTYGGSLVAEGDGPWTVEILASDPATANFGYTHQHLR